MYELWTTIHRANHRGGAFGKLENQSVAGGNSGILHNCVVSKIPISMINLNPSNLKNRDFSKLIIANKKRAFLVGLLRLDPQAWSNGCV